MKLRKLLFTLPILFLISGTLALGQSKNSADDKLYDELRTIRGKVTILNHPSLGKTAGRNIKVLLQRLDCRKCLISVEADSEGNYSVTVSKGKYRLIYRSQRIPNGPTYDYLAPMQQRIIDASATQSLVRFDIDISLPIDSRE